MKAKLFIGLAVATVAIAAATVFAVNHFSPKSQMSDLTRANLEALTDTENNTTGTQCPDNHVPDRFIKAGNITHVQYQSNSQGYVNIGGTLYGGYERNKLVIVPVQTYNCDGQQEGACCDQDRVGTVRV
jgi:hypothetical protein